MYVTLGAWQYSMKGAPAAHRVEFFVGLDPPQDDIASPLAALGFYALDLDVAIGPGHTVPAGDSLWPGTRMSTLLVLRPEPPIIPRLSVQDFHVEFLQAVPLLPSEVVFKRTHQLDALLERWELAGVRFWDSGRSPEPAEDI